MAVRKGKGLFSDNGVWINPKVVRETVESLHVSPEWVQELFAENEHVYYPDDDETHALLSFCFLGGQHVYTIVANWNYGFHPCGRRKKLGRCIRSVRAHYSYHRHRINEDVKSRYLPWTDEVIGVKPEPMDWKPVHEPEPESVAPDDIAEREDDGVAQTYKDEGSRSCDSSLGQLVQCSKEAEENEVVARNGDSDHADDFMGDTASASSLGQEKENVTPVEHVYALASTVASCLTQECPVHPPLTRPSTLFAADAAHLDPPASRVPHLNTVEGGSGCENACFCGRNPPVHAVILRCRHRFCMEHLTTLRARAGTLENGNIVCPFCGDCHEQTITGGYLSVHVDEPVMI